MNEFRAIDVSEADALRTLSKKLREKRTRCLTRYKFYEMKNGSYDFGISTPPNLRLWNSTVGWCAKGVDALADRLVWRGFSDDNYNVEEIFVRNNPDIIPDSAILSALITSCSFIYLSEDGNGYPRMQVIDGANATGDINPITGLLNTGYAVLSRNEARIPTSEALFMPDRTIYFTNGKVTDIRIHGAGSPLLVPIINRPDASRPFGRSEISRACMSYTYSALRTIKRGEISAEFYSYPQKWVAGLSQDADLDRWKATMSSMLSITKDEDGDTPSFGQFTQQSMTPHVDHLRMFASLFAGETGLTLDDLGFPSDTPSSAESIRAAHENLRLKARKAQRCFSSGFLNAGFLAACLRDKMSYKRDAFYKTRVLWEPIFEADASALSGIGDAVMKLQQSFPDYFTEEKLRDMTGI